MNSRVNDIIQKESVKLRQGYLNFLKSCENGQSNFLFTPKSDSSAYATTFAVFGHYLLQNGEYLKNNKDWLVNLIVKNITNYNKGNSSFNELRFNKPFMQLLTFSLSAIYCLGALKEIDKLNEVILQLIPVDIEKDLSTIRALDGVAQSGNKAMFLAILLLYAKEYLGEDTGGQLERWIELHLKSMNQNGFWGQSNIPTFLQFQNGYHQYEIFEYLGISDKKFENAASMTNLLVDSYGHFAPYPGGGGCYDYDATFVLTMVNSNKFETTLELTTRNLIKEQNSDGGFGESQSIRPLKIGRAIDRVMTLPKSTRLSSLKYIVNLQRSKHSRVHTHWSQYSREWGESDLWDSWFRMLTIARIDASLDQSKVKDWGFINFPGIGYFHGVSS